MDCFCVMHSSASAIFPNEHCRMNCRWHSVRRTSMWIDMTFKVKFLIEKRHLLQFFGHFLVFTSLFHIVDCENSCCSFLSMIAFWNIIKLYDWAPLIHCMHNTRSLLSAGDLLFGLCSNRSIYMCGFEASAEQAKKMNWFQIDFFLRLRLNPVGRRVCSGAYTLSYSFFSFFIHFICNRIKQINHTQRPSLREREREKNKSSKQQFSVTILRTMVVRGSFFLVFF